jgi:C1A family cysteine protease
VSLGKRGLGWRPDPVDGRDKMASRIFGDDLPQAPIAADLFDSVVEILDQADTSACVAFAVAQQLRIAMREAGDPAPPLPSTLAIYSWARAVHGDQHQDGGTWIRSAYQAIGRLGFPPASAWPFIPHRVNWDPPFPVFHAAADQRPLTVDNGGGYFRIPTVGVSLTNYIRTAIAEGHPVAFGTAIDSAFFDHAGDEPWTRTGGTIGGHAMCVCGYDAEGVIVANSWGTGWGSAGLGRISWEQIMSSDAGDFWVVKTAPAFARPA